MDSHTWDYSFLYGPSTWASHWKVGSNQSPIDIDTAIRVTDKTLKELEFLWNGGDVVIENNGKTVRYSPERCSYVIGGPLQYKNLLHEAHIHWGRNNNKGSEHSMDGRKFDGEIHLVHWNNELHSTFPDALKHPCGLCVLAVFFEIDDLRASNKSLKTMLDLLQHVPYKGDSHVACGVNLYDVMQSFEYVTYDGSLTTPPLAECVTWVVFKEPIKVHSDNIQTLMSLKAVSKRDFNQEIFHDPFSREKQCHCEVAPFIGDNYREQTPLNGRNVKSNF